MKVKKDIKEKRLNQTKKLYKQISSNNENYKEELFKIIKNSKDLKKDITEAFYSNFTDILSSSLSEIKNLYPNSYNDKEILDFSELLYHEDGLTLEDRVDKWITKYDTNKDDLELLYHLSLILETGTKSIIAQAQKRKITTPYVEITSGECEECVGTNGEVVLEDEVEFPPYHPGCTCEVIYYEEEDLEPDEIETKEAN